MLAREGRYGYHQSRSALLQGVAFAPRFTEAATPCVAQHSGRCLGHCLSQALSHHRASGAFGNALALYLPPKGRRNDRERLGDPKFMQTFAHRPMGTLRPYLASASHAVRDSDQANEAK